MTQTRFKKGAKVFDIVITAEQAQNLTNVINNAKSMEGTSMEVLEFFTQFLTEGLQQMKMEIAHADLAAAGLAAKYYDLQGRRLDAKPSRAGVYINNGVKRVNK